MSINICPVCRYHSVLLVPHSSWGAPCVCTALWVNTAKLCYTHWINLWVEGLHVHVLWHPLLLLDLVLGGVARDTQKGPEGWPESLARTLPITQGRGNVNNSLHCFFWFLIVPSAKGSFSDLLSHFPTLSYLPPEKRGRGILTLNIQIDFTLGLAQSFINRGGYLMHPWI